MTLLINILPERFYYNISVIPTCNIFDRRHRNLNNYTITLEEYAI